MYFVYRCGAEKSSCCHGTLNKVFDSQSGSHFNIKCDTFHHGADAAGQKEQRDVFSRLPVSVLFTKHLIYYLALKRHTPPTYIH